MNNLRIMYMGTPELSSEILEGLIQNGINIVAVVAQNDKPVGRKGIIMPVPTKVVASKYNIPVYQVEKIRLDYEFVKEINPDLIITCAYGQIVPQGLLDIPKYGCINVHGSLLPKYRGASPIQSALINGEKETGVTIMEMIDKMDAGGMLLKKSFVLEEDDNYTSVCKKISKAGLEGLLECIPLIAENKAVFVPQNEDEVTYCKKILKDDEHLDVNDTVFNVINKIRGLSETPGAYLLMDDQVFKIYKAKKYSDELGNVGEIVQADKRGVILQLVDGQNALFEIQKQGKKKMDYKSYINGEKNLVGKLLK